MGLAKSCLRGENIGMRTGRALVLIAMLAAQPTWVFGDGTVSPPNPVGERLYAQHLLTRMAPIAIMAGGLLLGWVASRIHRKGENVASDDVGPHQS